MGFDNIDRQYRKSDVPTARRIEWKEDASIEEYYVLPDGPPFDGTPVLIRAHDYGWTEAEWDKSDMEWCLTCGENVPIEDADYWLPMPVIPSK